MNKLLSEFSSLFLLTMNVSCLFYLHWTFIFLHSFVYMLDIAAVLAWSSLSFFADHVFLLVFQLSLAFIVELAHLSQLIVLSYSFLIHHAFCYFLSFLQFFLHSNFSTHSCLKDFLGNSSVNGLQTLFFS